MIFEGTLSLSRQAKGRFNYNMFNVVNGLSYMCLGETIIILFALRFDCPAYIIAAMSSFIYLGHFAMPLGKILSSKIGGAKSISLCWVFRNIAAITVASAFFLQNYKGAAIVLITVGTLLFYACRSAGTVVMQPLIGEITTPENRGKFISASSLFFDLARLICLGAILVILKFSDSLITLTAIIAVGSLFGFTSAYFLSRIDETTAIKISASQPILSEFKKLFTTGIRRRQLMANLIGSCAIAMIVPVSVLILKKGYGISDNGALLFSLVQFGGAVASYYVIGMISNVTGPKPVLTLSYLMIVLVCVYWFVAPLEFVWWYCAIPFLVIGVSSAGMGVTLVQYFLRTIPDKERVGASLSMYVVSGISASIISIVVSSTLLKNLPKLPYAEIVNVVENTRYLKIFSKFASEFADPATATLRIYQLYLLLIFVMFIACLPFFMRIRSYSRWRVKDVIGLAFAPRDMLTLYNLYRIKSAPTQVEDEENIERLEIAHSSISESALLAALESPKLAVRSRALLALSELQLSESGRKAVLHELENGEHTTANIAAQICGNLGMIEAIPIMRLQIETTGDYYLKSKALLALAQFRDTVSYEAIERIFSETENPRLLLHGAAALAETGEGRYAFTIFHKIATTKLSNEIVSELLCSFAELGGFGDAFYRFIRLRRKSQASALAFLVEFLCEKRSPNDSFNIRFGEMTNLYEKSSVGGSDIISYIMPEVSDAPDGSFAASVKDSIEKSSYDFDSMDNLSVYAIVCALLRGA